MFPHVSSWPLLYLAGCQKSRNNLSALHQISVHRNVPVFCRHWQNLKPDRYRSLHFILTERILSFLGLFNDTFSMSVCVASNDWVRDVLLPTEEFSVDLGSFFFPWRNPTVPCWWTVNDVFQLTTHWAGVQSCILCVCLCDNTVICCCVLRS